MNVTFSNNSYNYFPKDFSSYFLVNKQIKNLFLFLQMPKSLKLHRFHIETIWKPVTEHRKLPRENSKSKGEDVLQSTHRSWFHFPLAPSGGNHSVLLIPIALTGRIYYKYCLTLQVLLNIFIPPQNSLNTFLTFSVVLAMHS